MSDFQIALLELIYDRGPLTPEDALDHVRDEIGNLAADGLLEETDDRVLDLTREGLKYVTTEV